MKPATLCVKDSDVYVFGQQFSKTTVQQCHFLCANDKKYNFDEVKVIACSIIEKNLPTASFPDPYTPSNLLRCLIFMRGYVDNSMLLRNKENRYSESEILDACYTWFMRTIAANVLVESLLLNTDVEKYMDYDDYVILKKSIKMLKYNVARRCFAKFGLLVKPLLAKSMLPHKNIVIDMIEFSNDKSLRLNALLEVEDLNVLCAEIRQVIGKILPKCFIEHHGNSKRILLENLNDNYQIGLTIYDNSHVLKYNIQKMKDAMVHLHNAALLLFRGRGFGNEITESFTYSTYSHYGIFRTGSPSTIFESSNTYGDYDKSTSSIVRITKFEKRVLMYDGKIDALIFNKKLTPRMDVKFDEFVRCHLGKEYSRNTIKTTPCVTASRNSYGCGMLCAAGYNAVGIFPDEIISNNFFPGQFDAYFKNKVMFNDDYMFVKKISIK